MRVVFLTLKKDFICTRRSQSYRSSHHNDSTIRNSRDSATTMDSPSSVAASAAAGSTRRGTNASSRRNGEVETPQANTCEAARESISTAYAFDFRMQFGDNASHL